MDAGTDAAPGCIPGTYRCSGTSAERCAADGVRFEAIEACAGACDFNLGCVACAPGARRCTAEVSEVCDTDGGGWARLRDCAEWGSACGTDGFCADACAAVERDTSYLGCEYVAVTLPNYILEPTSAEYRPEYEVRLVITQPDDREANPMGEPATVVVQHGATTVATVTVPAGGLEEVVLPYLPSGVLSPGGASAWRSAVFVGAGYRVRSDRPVAVAQFSPFEYALPRGGGGGGDTPAYSNDASLLLPVNALGRDHVVPSWEALVSPKLTLAGYVAVVGTRPEPTIVRAFGRSPIAATDNGATRPIEGGVEFTLGLGDVAILLPVSPGVCTEDFCGDGDPSGMRIESDAPVAVFGGHSCVNVPTLSAACDHLEEQIPPTDRLGLSYTGIALLPPEIRSFNVLRVYGTADDTVVEVRSADRPDQSLRIDRGRFEEARVTGAFEVVANRPVLVALYMTGATLAIDRGGGLTDLGDPSLTYLPAREQYRSDYVFVAPRSYSSETMGQVRVALDRAPGTPLLLDGVRVDEEVVWSTISGREVGILPVPPGVHSLRSEGGASEPVPFGATLFGMGLATSFAYPVGLDLPRVF